MSKSTRITPEQLRLMNLEEVEPGVYKKKKYGGAPFYTKDASDHTGKNDGEKLFKEMGNGMVYMGGVDPVSDEPSHSAVVVGGKLPNGDIEYDLGEHSINDVVKEAKRLYGEYYQGAIENGQVRLKSTVDDAQNITPEMWRSVDELWNPKPKPFDIASIRALGSGTKARKQSMEHLHQFAKELVENRGMDVIYIEGNVPSSKNSKEIAKFKKRVNGKLVEMASLIDSKVTTKYKKDKANTYALHKHRFLEMIQGKPFPISVQFTFIRKDIGRFDFGNAQQIVADLMVDHGWIPDDCTEYFVPVFNPVVYYSAQCAGVIIKVL